MFRTTLILLIMTSTLINPVYLFSQGEGYPCSKEYPPTHKMYERCFQLANGQRAVGMYDQAIDNFKRLLNVAEKYNDRYRIAQTKLHIGFTYHDMFKAGCGKIEQINEDDSLKCLNYIEMAHQYVTEASRVFEDRLYSDLKESSYINSKKLINLLEKQYDQFMSPRKKTAEEKLLEYEVENTKTLNEKLLEIINLNMRFNHNVMELVKSTRRKDSVWYELTKLFMDSRRMCDTAEFYDRYLALDFASENYINNNNIVEIVKPGGAGYTDFYLIKGKPADKHPDLYLRRLEDMNSDINNLKRRITDFTGSLEQCIANSYEIEEEERAVALGIWGGADHSYLIGSGTINHTDFNNETTEFYPGFIAGFFIEADIFNNVLSEDGAISIRPEFSYTRKGSRWESLFMNEPITYTMESDCIDFNFFFKWDVASAFSVFAGPSVSYFAESSLKGITDTDKYKDKLEDIDPFDFGLTFGIGSGDIPASFPVSKSFYRLDLRYFHTLNESFFKGGNLRNRVLGLTFSYGIYIQ